MTERQGVLPPDGTEDGTFHWIGAPGYSVYLWEWKSGEWIEGSLRRRPEISWFAGFYYIGPAPTHEQAQADATDIPTFGTTTIATPYIPDIWQKTTNLRWNGGTLEQQWLNDTGKTQWEPVPTKDPTHD